MKKESFQAAKEKIRVYLYSDSLLAYTTFDIQTIFNSKRTEWNIAEYRNQYHFISFLKEQKILEEKTLKRQIGSRLKQIYVEPDATPFHIGQTIKKEGYLSNYTAMYIHQLTLQIPKSIYVSFDKGGVTDNTEEFEFEQMDIDIAFSKPQRITSEVYKSEDDNIRYFLIQRSHLKNVGILYQNNYYYTDLERTLIDIAVRPAYSGGVFEVLEAFEAARPKANISKLSKYLTLLSYRYPYHQLIGFYLEKAGYDQEEVEKFFLKNIGYNFYLTYNISNKEYNAKWRIFYPKGF